MPIPPTIDTISWNVMMQASPNWTSQISYDAVTSLLREQSLFDVVTSFSYIAAKYNRPLVYVNAHTDDDRYDIVECSASAAGQPQLDLLDQL